MADPEVQCSALEVAEGMPASFVVTIMDGDISARLVVVESTAGSERWRVVELAILHPHNVTPAMVRTLPAKRYRDLAVTSVRRTVPPRGRVRLGYNGPSSTEPPEAFQSSRRGRSKRTPEDYAWLAYAYSNAYPDVRRSLPRVWAEQFADISERTWRNHLVEARKYLHEDGTMTREGNVLAFGAAFVADMEAEFWVEDMDRIARGEWLPGEIDEYRRDGRDPDEVRGQAIADSERGRRARAESKPIEGDS